MLKETKFVLIIFIIGGILIWLTSPLLLATPMLLKKLMQLKLITNGGRRRAMFVIFRKRKSLFNAI